MLGELDTVREFEAQAANLREVTKRLARKQGVSPEQYYAELLFFEEAAEDFCDIFAQKIIEFRFSREHTEKPE